MSGHSKWSTIKHKKAKQDTKRGKIFSQLSRMIRVAVKEQGNGDPEQNPALRTALDRAREANMPKENIQRAIDRGLGKSSSGTQIEEVVYEGYSPGGVGFMVWAVTDNRNRTGAEVRYVFEKAGGSLGGPGTTAYLFDLTQKGKPKIQVPLAVEGAEEETVARMVETLEEHEDVEMVVTNLAS